MCDVHLSREDIGVLVTCATRYAIGRQSYMPYLVTGIVKPMLDKLDDKTLGCLIRDIESAPSLGDPNIDAPLWKMLLSEAMTMCFVSAETAAETWNRRTNDEKT